MFTRRNLYLLTALVAVKAALMLVDGAPSVFMGDSRTYLDTALHGHIPLDRSFAYGFLLRPLAVWPHSLGCLVAVQAGLSAVSAWLIAFILTEYFAVGFGVAAVLSLLCSLEPLQLLSERYVMTDTIALFLFAVLVTITVSFCRRPNGFRLTFALLAGVTLISLRVSYLPLVLLISLVLPVILVYARHWPRFRAAATLVVWIGTGQLLLFGYRELNAKLSHIRHPAYLYTDGQFLLSDVAPIVTASDFPRTVSGTQILDAVRVSLADPGNRQAQFFARNGLCGAIRDSTPDAYRANELARSVALRSIRNHPVQFARLALHTWGEYFDFGGFRIVVRDSEGGLGPGDEAFRQQVQSAVGTDLSKQSFSGPVWRWHRAATPWYWALVTLPVLLGGVFVLSTRRRDFAALPIHFFLIVLFVQAVVLTPHAEPRYLIPVAWLVLLSLGVNAETVSVRNFSRRGAIRRRRTMVAYGGRGLA